MHFFCMLPLLAQFSEDFESYNCDRNNAATWSFSGFSLSGANSIDGCSARSSQLSNPNGDYSLASPLIASAGNATATFSYKVTNTSSTPGLELYLVDLDNNQETLLWSVSVPSGNTVYQHSQNFTATSNCRLKWKATGSQGGSRMILDNIYVPAFQPLPVELTDFSADRDGASILLEWGTANEVNFAGFEVLEIIPDGAQKLGFVAAAGPGRYRFSVEKATPGSHYFRLKVLDNDQSFTYSPVVQVEVPAGEGILMKREGRAGWSLRFPEVLEVAQVQVDVFTMAGAMVFSKKIETDGGNELEFTLPTALPTGILVLRAIVDGRPLATKFHQN